MRTLRERLPWRHHTTGCSGIVLFGIDRRFCHFLGRGNQHQKTPPETQNVIAPDAALDRLMKGNDRYVQGVSCRHDFAHEREALAGGQNPFAAVLSCVDSRIAPECFDTARGDLFVRRIARNCERRNDRQLEYAVQVLNTPLIISWTRCLRRGRCHDQIRQGQLDITRPSALPGRGDKNRR